jgi:hypothetical protein
LSGFSLGTPKPPSLASLAKPGLHHEGHRKQRPCVERAFNPAFNPAQRERALELLRLLD